MLIFFIQASRIPEQYKGIFPGSRFFALEFKFFFFFAARFWLTALESKPVSGK